MVKPLASNVNQDSSAVKKIGDYYYYTGNCTYQYSKDLINWTDYEVFPCWRLREGSAVWASTLFEDPISNKIYVFHSVMYDDTNVIPINGSGATDVRLFRIDMYEVEQNEDGSLAVLTPDSPTTIIGGDLDESYIDPFMAYNENLGYILAVKNEKTAQIEIYNGQSIDSLELVSMTNNLIGVEAPQLVQNEAGDVLLFADAYNPKTVSYLSDPTSGAFSANSLIGGTYVARVALGKYQASASAEFAFVSQLLWTIVDTPARLRHPGFTICDWDAYTILSKMPVLHIPEDRAALQTGVINSNANNNKIVFTNVPSDKYCYALSGGGLGTINCEYKPIYTYIGPIFLVGSTAKSTINNAILKVGSGISGYSASVNKKIDLTNLSDAGPISFECTLAGLYALATPYPSDFFTVASGFTVTSSKYTIRNGHVNALLVLSSTNDIASSAQAQAGTIEAGFRPTADFNYGAFFGTGAYTTTQFGYLFVRASDGAVFVKANATGQKVVKILLDYYIN